MYVKDKCGCDPCTEASRVYCAERRRRMAYGQPLQVDCAPIREHMNELRARGVAVRTIAAEAGIPEATLHWILYGRAAEGKESRRQARWVRPATASAILSVKGVSPDLVPDRGFVSATGTRRRLQALARIGWSPARLARQYGFHVRTLQTVTAGRVDWVTAKTFRAVRGFFDDLWETPAPAESREARISVSRTVAWAARNCWAAPMEWDEDTIDDPDAVPYTPEPRRPGSIGVDLDEFMHLVRGGVGYEEAAERLGVLVESVSNRARDLGRPDIVVMLAEAVHRVRHAKDAPSKIRDEMTLRANLPARREVSA
jgi:lambda repressor-like predicted transcriptional regulator